jgi:hypothetical protein
VFQDPRINGYPPGFHAVLERDDLSPAAWQAFIDGFGVTAALITYPDLNPRAALFSPARWALVHRDAEALVFVARLPGWRALIAGHEQPLTFSYARDRGVTPEPLPERPAASPLRDCEWQRRLGDEPVTFGARSGEARAAYDRALATPGCLDERATAAARIGLGDLALAAGDRAAAVAAYDGVRDPRARANRGLALLALGRAADAAADLTAALSADPRQAEAQLGLGFALEALGRRPQAAAAFEAFLSLAPAHPAAARARAELAGLRP